MQLGTVLKFHLNNLTFWREFLTKASLKRGRGLNWSIWIPCNGIVKDQNQPQLPVDTTLKFVNISPSPCTLVVSFFYSNHSPYPVQRWMLQREEPTLSSRGVRPWRGRVQPSRLPKGSSQRKLTVNLLRNPKLLLNPSWGWKLGVRKSSLNPP